MKKTLITLLILIFATNLFSQETREIKQTANYYQSQEVLLTSETFVPEQKDTHLINITPNSGDTGWKYIGDQIAGNPGYWYQVLRSDDTVLAEDSTRYYYFYLNLFSASTYKDGTKAATYIKDIDYCIKDSLLGPNIIYFYHQIK